jgi:hypothetical protein
VSGPGGREGVISDVTAHTVMAYRNLGIASLSLLHAVAMTPCDENPWKVMLQRHHQEEV